MRGPRARLDPARLAAALLTGVLGLLAVSIPVTAFVFLVVFSLVDQSGDVPRLFAGVFFAGAAVGFGIDQLARRLRARTADEAIDDRVEEPPILYLRNFGDDRQKIPVSALSRRGLFALVVTAVSPIRQTRFEELLARTLGRWGPVVALSDPNVSLPTLGAAKIEPLGDDWRDVVRARANAAHAVVVSATPGQVGPGLRWELDLLAHAVPHGRIVLVLGPGPDRATPAQCFSTFLAETERFAAPHRLDLRRRGGCGFGFCREVLDGRPARPARSGLRSTAQRGRPGKP